MYERAIFCFLNGIHTDITHTASTSKMNILYFITNKADSWIELIKLYLNVSIHTFMLHRMHTISRPEGVTCMVFCCIFLEVALKTVLVDNLSIKIRTFLLFDFISSLIFCSDVASF